MRRERTGRRDKQAYEGEKKKGRGEAGECRMGKKDKQPRGCKEKVGE